MAASATNHNNELFMVMTREKNKKLLIKVLVKKRKRDQLKKENVVKHRQGTRHLPLHAEMFSLYTCCPTILALWLSGRGQVSASI
jgi:hypothetical protein